MAERVKKYDLSSFDNRRASCVNLTNAVHEVSIKAIAAGYKLAMRSFTHERLLA